MPNNHQAQQQHAGRYTSGEGEPFELGDKVWRVLVGAGARVWRHVQTQRLDEEQRLALVQHRVEHRAVHVRTQRCTTVGLLHTTGAPNMCRVRSHDQWLTENKQKKSNKIKNNKIKNKKLMEKHTLN